MHCRRLVAALGTTLLLGAMTSCDPGTATAPEGAILRISAQPTRISKDGTSDVTVQLVRANGAVVNPGTEVRLSSTIGTIDPVVHTDSTGTAHATLTGDGRVGTATITAYSGAVDPVTVDIAVGSLAASVRLQVTPSSVPETGGILDLLALVRDDQGQPLPDATVNFTSQVGTLASGGSFITSDSSGAAHDVLTVTQADLQVVSGDTFDVTAEVGGSAGVEGDTFAVAIQRSPRAAFTYQRVDNTVSFTDTSTGGPTTWLWTFGDSTPSSSQRNPVHTYAASGSYTVTLTVSNAIGTDTTSAIVQIP